MSIFRCNKCGDTFPNAQGLGSHKSYSEKHGCLAPRRGYNAFRWKSGTIYKCLFCGTKRKSAIKMGHHAHTHRKNGDTPRDKPTNLFECPYCHEKNLNRGQIGAHIKWKHALSNEIKKAPILQAEKATQALLFEREVCNKLDGTVTALKVADELNRILEKDEPLTDKETKLIKEHMSRFMAAHGLRSKNTKFLRGLMCPKCKASDKFAILGAVDVIVTDDGIDKDELDRVYWDDKDRIQCLSCQHKGSVGSFSVGTGVSMSAAFIKK